MSTAGTIVTAAYRENNVVAKVGTPDSLELAEGLALLNSLILSVLGNEVGKELHDIAIGGAYDQSQFISPWIPENSRFALNRSVASTYQLHPRPYEGQRVAIVDVANNLATYNAILSGNGRLIEGATSVTLSTNGLARQWMYRGDTGNWVRVSSLVSTDEMPFPVEFDDYFQTRLAMRLNPRHNAATAQETIAALKRSETQLRARYRRPRGQQDLGTPGLLNSNRDGFSLGFDLLR